MLQWWVDGAYFRCTVSGMSWQAVWHPRTALPSEVLGRGSAGVTLTRELEDSKGIHSCCHQCKAKDCRDTMEPPLTATSDSPLAHTHTEPQESPRQHHKPWRIQPNRIEIAVSLSILSRSQNSFFPLQPCIIRACLSKSEYFVLLHHVCRLWVTIVLFPINNQHKLKASQALAEVQTPI